MKYNRRHISIITKVTPFSGCISLEAFFSFTDPSDLYQQVQTGNFMTTINKMILQSEGKDIYLLPAWPKDWNVKFKLHAPHRTVVQGEWKNGRWVDIRTSPQQRKIDIRSVVEF